MWTKKMSDEKRCLKRNMSEKPRKIQSKKGTLEIT